MKNLEQPSTKLLKSSSPVAVRAFLALLTLFCFSTALLALPPERKDMRAGNKAYGKGDYATAEIEYRRALDKVSESANAKFNLGNALFKQTDSADMQGDGVKQQVEQARKLYETVAEADVRDEQKAAAYYNQGNTYLRDQDFRAAAEAYKKSLRLNPNDMEAKQNLVYAQAMSNMQQQQPQPQPQQNQDQNKNDDQNKDQNKDQQQDQPQDDKNQPDKPQPQDKNQPDKQQQQREEKISKEDAQRMLQALEQQEKETQEKVKKEKAQKAKQRSTEKNW
ncbi:MAG: tetratricopeptide repeat protein [Prevotellaceae bacterium]|jgi:tetratricopeptide (TPR) repeat protein|nr:tetratricopeptide repeat protein [Prevotellaceae bacterium]